VTGSQINVTRKKGWIKLHAAVSTLQVQAQKIAITSAHKHDSQMLPLLVTGKEDQIFADKAYDSRKIFNLLDSNGTDAIIPLRKNFRTTARGSPLRHRIARRIHDLGEEQWKKNNNYGRRWIVETYFSGLKRVMGEVIKARKLEYVIQEIGLKVLYYNYLRSDTMAYG
jgi:IS5 family transposase